MTARQRPINRLHRSISKSYNLLINHSIECLNYNQMLITASGLLIGFAVVFGLAAPLFADYTLRLKNGRTVNVDAYKEEGGMIIFSSYGGEISIAKEDVQSIIPVVEGLATRKVPPQTDVVPGESAETVPGEERVGRPGQGQEMKEQPVAIKEKVLTPEEIRAEKRAKEEKEYQKRVREVTERLKATRDRYAVATMRATGPDPTKPCVFNCGKITKARVADLNSRSKDADRTPAGPHNRGSVKLAKPSPFTGAPPTIIDLKPGGAMQRINPPLTPYSPKEKKLSQLRGQILALEKERDRLIQEMRDRNFNTASLILQ